MSVPRPTTSHPGRGRLGLAIGIGNFVEWFDFAVYSSVVATIGDLFFPSDDPVGRILSAFSIFAVGFLLRPLGGLAIGRIADRFGRKTALVLSVGLMGAATTLIGLLPTYQQIGLWAPVALVLVRGFQGLSAGGESVSAITYLVESSSTGNRGRYVSIVPSSVALSFVAGAGITWLLQASLDEASFQGWGWRVPFLIAAPLTLIALYVRNRLAESPIFTALEEQGVVTRRHRLFAERGDVRNFLLVFALTGLGGLGLYYLNTYLSTHLSTQVGLPRPEALALSSLGLFGYAAICPLAGYLADRYGRRPVFLAGTISFIVLTVPVFLLLGTAHPVLILIAYLLQSIGQSLVIVASFLYLVELVPSHTRNTTASLSYNIAYAVLAGTGPLVATWLVQVTGNTVAPAWYLVAVAVLVLPVIVYLVPETHTRDLLLPSSAPSARRQRESKLIR